MLGIYFFRVISHVGKLCRGFLEGQKFCRFSTSKKQKRAKRAFSFSKFEKNAFILINKFLFFLKNFSLDGKNGNKKRAFFFVTVRHHKNRHFCKRLILSFVSKGKKYTTLVVNK